MKKYFLFAAILFISGIRLHATTDSDSLGLPGDNLDLAAVLNLFQNATSLEDFEKKLNDPTTQVNNLDLNNDQNVDYIRVVDQVSEDAHDIVLQVPVSETESQDVAVIELEKNGSESAQLQIKGDEDLYGENYFVEPTADDNNKVVPPTTEKKFGDIQGFRPIVVFVNVWMWPCVRFMYAPTYVMWVSPWRWMYYPTYWRPWHPMMWRAYYGGCRHYHEHCCCVHECRMRNANSYYGPHRMASPSVHRAVAEQHERNNVGHEVQRTANTQTSNPQTKGGQGNSQRVTQPGEKPSPMASGKAEKRAAKNGKAGPRGQRVAQAPKGNRSGGQQRGGGGQQRGGGQHMGGGRPSGGMKGGGGRRR